MMNTHLAMGMRPGELIEPYAFNVEPEKRDQYLLWLCTQQGQIIRCGSNVDAIPILDSLKTQGVTQLVISGAYARACVAGTIVSALQRQMRVFTFEQGLVESKFSYPKTIEISVAQIAAHENQKPAYVCNHEGEMTIFTPLEFKEIACENQS